MRAAAPPLFSRWWGPRAVILALAASTVAACTAPGAAPVRPSPSIVLITLEGLRADVVGALADPANTTSPANPGSATPSLDRFAAEADWVGRGVASSGWAAPAGASIFTGLNPWKHQVLVPRAPRLRSELVTLPEALAALGYRTTGFAGGPWLGATQGYRQGFDVLRPLRRRGRTVRGQLRGVERERDFVWIHLPHPCPPWQRRDWLLDDEQTRLGLPREVLPEELEVYLDPGVRPGPAELERLRALYRNNVAWADVHLGRFLEALRESGHWEQTLVVVTSTHGEELGEEGRVGEGGSLARALLEVPLVVKLPRGFGRSLAVPPEQRVATARLFSTLVQAAGGETPPGVAPSLFDRRAPRGVLSELYDLDDSNLFSLVEGDDQLVWRYRLAPGVEVGAGHPGAVFRTSLPLAALRGGRAPELALRRWDGTGAAAAAPQGRPDPRAAVMTATLAVELERRFLRFLGDPMPPVRAAEELSSARR
jgi:hypothetical protein